MSSSEEENFDIDISDDESEEDYAPVVKKKATTTVRSGTTASWVVRLTASLVQNTEERREGYHEADCEETCGKTQGDEEVRSHSQG